MPYEYQYNEGKLREKANQLIEEIKRTQEKNTEMVLTKTGFNDAVREHAREVNFHNSDVETLFEIRDIYTNPHLRDKIQEILDRMHSNGTNNVYTTFEAEKNRNDQCKIGGETLVSKIGKAIKEKCHFEITGKVCEGVKEKALGAACGKEDVNFGKHCANGLAGTEIQKRFTETKGSLTPESIKYWTEYRDRLFAKAVVLKDGVDRPSKDGYEECLDGIKYASQKRCFEVYDIVFDGLKQLEKDECTPKAIDEYVKTFKKIVNKQNGPMKVFSEIKNNYALARLCTIKIVRFAEKLDKGLKEATEKLNAADHSTSRETASNGGR